jgi:hypothetical protein
MPPAIDQASYPDARKAWAAIVERPPTRQMKTIGRSLASVAACADSSVTGMWDVPSAWPASRSYGSRTSMTTALPSAIACWVSSGVTSRPSAGKGALMAFEDTDMHPLGRCVRIAIMDRMRSSLPVPVAVVVLTAVTALAGCGSGNDGRSASTASATTSGATAPSVPKQANPATPFRPRGLRSLQLPAGVPTTSDGGAADAVSARVIKKWSAALSGGDIKRAARFFALPSKVQNGTPVVTLDTAEKRLVFNVTFPCGAKPTKLEAGGNGYTIVDFVLTERVDGNCGNGVGGKARTAIRVRGGHISDWYRIPDAAVSPSPSPSPPPSGSGAPDAQIA